MKSNCLLEAVKAKIKNPRDVKIIVLPGKVFGAHLHIMWRDEEKVLHAFDPNFNPETSKFINRICYTPSFKTNSIESFEAYVLDCLKRKSKKMKIEYSKKFGLKAYEISGVLDWATYFVDEDPEIANVPKKEDYEYLSRVFKGKILIKVIEDRQIKTVTFEELLNNPGASYKYVTPFDDDYTAVFGYFKSKDVMQDLN